MHPVKWPLKKKTQTKTWFLFYRDNRGMVFGFARISAVCSSHWELGTNSVVDKAMMFQTVVTLII